MRKVPVLLYFCLAMRNALPYFCLEMKNVLPYFRLEMRNVLPYFCLEMSIVLWTLSTWGIYSQWKRVMLYFLKRREVNTPSGLSRNEQCTLDSEEKSNCTVTVLLPVFLEMRTVLFVFLEMRNVLESLSTWAMVTVQYSVSTEKSNAVLLMSRYCRNE